MAKQSSKRREQAALIWVYAADRLSLPRETWPVYGTTAEILCPPSGSNTGLRPELFCLWLMVF